MNRLSTLFEEDIEMQDMIENLDGISDDSEELIIKVTEDRYNNERPHLFVNDVVDESCKREAEELAKEDEFDFEDDEDDIDDEDLEEFLDDDGDKLF